MKVKGLEHIPKHGPFILASNHISYLDPMVLPVTCSRKMAFVAKEQLFQKKGLGFILKHLGAFPIRRQSSDIKAIRQILKCLKQGRPVLIFPEGTRKAKNQNQDVQSGIGMIAVKTKLPVVPVRVDGTDKVLPPGTKKMRRHPVTVTYGPPLHFPQKDDYSRIAGEVMHTINALSL
jgi:1-acyl-sn-glycerol-3-phosphate acyltransferase